jgi:hypothetical protein
VRHIAPLRVRRAPHPAPRTASKRRQFNHHARSYAMVA